MAIGDSHGSGFNVRTIGKSIIKAAHHNAEPYILPVSNFDHLSGRYPITLFYAYRKPTTGDFPSVVSNIEASFSGILAHFPPFAGRIVPSPGSGEAEILCNNEGAELIVALADVPLATLDFYDLNKSVKKVILPFDHEIPLSLQVVGYTCGGFSMTWSFDHLLADGAGFVKFLCLWSELARTKQITSVPNHDRSMFQPNLPPRYSPSIERVFTACTLDEILLMPPNNISLKRLYYVERSSVDRLQAKSSEDGCKRTKTEALSAHLWTMLARSLAQSDLKGCKMGWLVDGRSRVGRDAKAMSNYVGNVVSMAVGEATMQELKEGPLSHVAGIVSRAIGEVANEAHFMELVDWIERQRPGLVLAKILLGREGPAVVVSSCHNMPAALTDFGFGPPSMGTLYTTLEGMGAGYVNLASSGRGDGSWFVFAFLWPELAAELESDPDRVFQPMKLDYLGL